MTAGFQWPFGAEAVLESVSKFLPLDNDEFKRALADAVGKMTDRDRAVEDSLTVPSGTVAVVSADPTTPADGVMWINATSGQMKVRINGATRVVTVV